MDDSGGHQALAQLCGAIVGGILGGAIGGSVGLLIGALLGWLVVAAVQAQNKRARREAQALRRTRAAERRAPPPATATEASSFAREATAPEMPAIETPTREAPPSQPPVVDSATAEPGFPWLTRLVSGNIVAKVGVLILFFGVGFLLKYAYDQGVLPVPVRLAGVAAVGFGMGFAGWRLLERRRLYALILQGGGIGLLYLDVFFALRVYGLVGATTGFAAFMALGVAATLLAVRQNARVLAVLGLTGAFLAPVLASTGGGDHVLLFSYYTLLNAFILAISWFKAWRELNLVGFIFTFVVALLWGANNYRPELFSTVEPFVLVFFAMYLVIPILFAQRQPPQLRGLVDGTLVFGTPLCVAFMQAALVKNLPYGLAWSAGVGSALFGVLAAMTLRREGMRLLGETYIALSAVLLTLAIFFAFDAYPTFALWTLEGAAIIWVGLRQRRVLARWFGYALQLAGAGYFVLHYIDYDLSAPFWNEFVLGCAFIAVAGFVISWLLRRYVEMRGEGEPSSSFAALWAAAWWAIAGVHALHHAYAWAAFAVALLVYIGASVAAFETIGARLKWRELRELAFVHLPALAAVAFMMAFGADGRFELSRPLAHGGYWAWPLNLLALFWIQSRHVRDGLMAKDNVLLDLRWIFIAAIATWDAVWLLAHGEYAQTLGWGAAALVIACVRYRLREREAERAAPIALAVLLWGLAFWFVAGLAWIDRDLASEAKAPAVLTFAALSCYAFEILGGFAQWPALRRCASLLPAGMALVLLAQIARGVHPFAEYGWLTWPTALLLQYVVMYRHEKDGIATLPPLQHFSALWILTIVLTWESAWRLDALSFGWPWLAGVCGLIPAAAVAALSRFSDSAAWPFGVHYAGIYREWALAPIAVWLDHWMFNANMSEPGSMQPIPYLPLLNPLDVASLAVLAALWWWSRTFESRHELALNAIKLLAGLAFLWINCVLLRTIHYWADVPYEWQALSQSVLVQSGFSLLWTASAFVLMLHATRRARRPLWIIGAVLLGVVVLKLFLNDLSSTGTIARIVSFLGVGAGLLAIGYVAPVPPGDRELKGD
jgi:uncharacterized membrane protein